MLGTLDTLYSQKQQHLKSKTIRKSYRSNTVLHFNEMHYTMFCNLNKKNVSTILPELLVLINNTKTENEALFMLTVHIKVRCKTNRLLINSLGQPVTYWGALTQLFFLHVPFHVTEYSFFYYIAIASLK